ncbi:MAG: hypothetical protein K0R39_617 [Symbiobacteriaceae bacterium]|jgi:spore maturation protein SpmB|nr:hypothetical protein [Symbiobacteriaceae bacterium]
MQLTASITKGTRAGLKVLWEMSKVMIPAMVVVNVLDKAGALPYLSQALGPAMALIGLPGEAALVLVSANFMSIFAGLATMMALSLTAKQITILSAMMMICHAAVSETAIVAKAGARAGWVLWTRLVSMVVVAALLNWLLP